MNVTINDRNYDSYKYDGDCDINPSILKLFNKDQISLDTKKIISSPTRSNIIPGILVLEGGKTFGRKDNKGKLLYRCIPNDTCLPIFLIPYEIKNIHFLKLFPNQYILFKFSEWKEKHPIGMITQTIGCVENNEAFYEYQLYCKNLYIPISNFNLATKKSLELHSYEKYIEQIIEKYNVEDRTSYRVFSIDPEGSLDFDDAFSINKNILSIYISNVTLWLDILNLWDSFSERVSTIYMPNKKYPMLPTILSDNICSLKANQKSFAFTMDINMDTFEIKYSNTMINPYKNYCYEDPALLKDTNYILIKESCNILQKSIIVSYNMNIIDSHDIVSYLMITMNYYTSKELLKFNNGIFRTAKKNNMDIDCDESIKNFMLIYNSTAGEYKNLDSKNQNSKNDSVAHEMLGLDSYIHITSPIRRLVDILNIIQFQQNTGMVTSDNMNCFYLVWITKLDTINIMMKKIKRVQSDCILLHHFTNSTKLIYDGYGIDNETVYIPELKSTFHVKTELGKCKVKLYLFKNEDKLKSKIRLMIL